MVVALDSFPMAATTYSRHLVIDVVEQVLQRHPVVKNEGIPEIKWR
jgi:hypothetical protein